MTCAYTGRSSGTTADLAWIGLIPADDPVDLVCLISARLQGAGRRTVEDSERGSCRGSLAGDPQLLDSGAYSLSTNSAGESVSVRCLRAITLPRRSRRAFGRALRS